jgi:ArsR family transcriptional regulator, arsenate/arsenite/antimonite-responsive transcriptional repressor
MTHPISTDYKEDEIILARFAKAMGHPARIAILKYLAALDSCCFGDINKELPIAKSTVSQHLAELKDAGLITGSIDPPKVNYCIDKENWKKATAIFEGFFKNSSFNYNTVVPPELKK